MAHHHHHRHRHEANHERFSSQHGEEGTMRARASLEMNQVADQVAALAQALRANGVTLRSGDQVVALRTAETAEFEVQAEEGRYSVVRLEIRWETPVSQETIEITSGTGQQQSAPQPEQSAPQPALRRSEPKPA